MRGSVLRSRDAHDEQEEGLRESSSSLVLVLVLDFALGEFEDEEEDENEEDGIIGKNLRD
jgi:hypothetical protein